MSSWAKAASVLFGIEEGKLWGKGTYFSDSLSAGIPSFSRKSAFCPIVNLNNIVIVYLVQK